MKEATDAKGKVKVLNNLHHMFGHPGRAKMIPFLKDAGIHQEGDNKLLEEIHKACEGCVLRRPCQVFPCPWPPVSMRQLLLT